MIALNRRQDADFRENWRKKLRDQELVQMIEEITAENAKAEKHHRPVQIKTFKV